MRLTTLNKQTTRTDKNMDTTDNFDSQHQTQYCSSFSLANASIQLSPQTSWNSAQNQVATKAKVAGFQEAP